MSNEFETVVGLEVHVELKTNTKIFCACKTAFGAEPNTQVCPICSGFPGMLPVLNKKVVELAIKTGLAINAEIASYCKFDRKNYFYPDLPNAYQISQFALPICTNGYLDIDVNGSQKRIRINRAHMEEDAGKLVHDGTITTTAFSLVDLNRTGVPLLEIVSEPDMRSAQEARAYLEKLRSMLLFAQVSDARMEEGSIRCDANVSVRRKGEEKLGVRAEIKNLNSFKAMEKAIEYEAKRQMEAIEDGETLIQETRTWDDEKGVTRSMRNKEEAHDYRYYPDPDLPPIQIDAAWIEEIKATLPEMPDAAKQRLQDQFGLPEYDAAIITTSPHSLSFFDQCVAVFPEAKTVSNWMMGELSRMLNQNNLEIQQCKITPAMLADLLKLIADGTISGKMAKSVFEKMFDSGNSAAQIIEEQGMVQISDEDTLRKIIAEIIDNNPVVVADYRSGKEKARGFLVGQVMKATKGQANPNSVNKILTELLTKEGD
ncbi:MAG TPA: Asp-tRNA(Asn)/Glu-tRNA(Gln) amidotransferase subunit GatB [Syntrophomonadaceae bacterium]|jgi:aspartyl-tRNA(Asn)/glutamyl-tRNA(Gln) amidotransferase subunit B|nr:Asp-tRNA(Asn)/Glu-tRNA(Gln) amidotransferase subunit GatB [Syntrophomonadaceae bacterium]HRX21660.1 Asp-tRNA(Asn)/Glu-tRNA(Gln) amidotransferase subunit GatB [Syntrophomonadaceae bacterium]